MADIPANQINLALTDKLRRSDIFPETEEIIFAVQDKVIPITI